MVMLNLTYVKKKDWPKVIAAIILGLILIASIGEYWGTNGVMIFLLVIILILFGYRKIRKF